MPPALNSFANQRCFHHFQREAALRCPGCARYYCRECASEHEGRWLCAACLGAAAGAPGERGLSGRRLLRGAALCVALGGIWLGFYAAGQVLLQVPLETHAVVHEPSGLFE